MQCYSVIHKYTENVYFNQGCNERAQIWSESQITLTLTGFPLNKNNTKRTREFYFKKR